MRCRLRFIENKSVSMLLKNTDLVIQVFFSIIVIKVSKYGYENTNDGITQIIFMFY